LFVPYVVADGVGNDEDAVPLVRGADGGRGYAVPLRVIPARGQLAENASKPTSKERCDVLHDDNARSKLANDPHVFEEETAARTVETGTASCDAEVLAGESSADDVDAREVGGSDGSDVLVSSGMGPVPFKDASAEGVNLDLPHDPRARDRALKPEFKSADATEE
jgi:hypothetical protein